MTKPRELLQAAPTSDSRIRRRPRIATPITIDELPVFSGSFIVGGDGRILHCSSESRVWLTVHGFESSMSRFVAALSAVTRDVRGAISFEPYGDATAVELISDEGETRYHVTVYPRRRGQVSR